jgi:DNA-binding GntR family transcriptional regulator
MSIEQQFRQRNLADQIADHIVASIAKGEIIPGQRLLETELCKTLGISRIPLREALRLLQAQGVVRSVPNRGSFVTEFGSTETAEMLEIRVSIERTAFRRVLKRIRADASLLEELAFRLEDLRRAARIDDQLTYCRADLAFHECVVELSGSPLLKAMWNALSRGVFFFLMQERSVKFDYKEQIRGHKRLVDLLQAGDSAGLEAEIERHILRNVSKKSKPT